MAWHATNRQATAIIITTAKRQAIGHDQLVKLKLHLLVRLLVGGLPAWPDMALWLAG